MVDFQRAVVGEDRPILDQISRYPSGIGRGAWAAVRRLVPFVAEMRRLGVPIVHTRLALRPSPPPPSGIYGNRVDREWDSSDTSDEEIIPELAPSEGELVVHKVHASAFLGTPLLPFLVGNGIETILLAGGSTSGCVRATAVDAAGRGFRVAVLAEATYDRIGVSHAASLLDIWMKYGAVWTLGQARSYVEQLMTEPETAR
jgi:nicotinamidase-related amidase